MLESLDGEREDFARQRIERAWCCYGGQRLRLRGDMGESKLDESRSVNVQGRASVGQQQWAKANGVSFSPTVRFPIPLLVTGPCDRLISL